MKLGNLEEPCAAVLYFEVTEFDYGLVPIENLVAHHEPLKETRNRKPLRPNPVAPWELRVGELRVFYEVSEGPPALVQVLAVGIKVRETLLIGGQEIKL